MYDVHVVGAGPAGSVCARECARRGLRVLLSEEHEKVGEPVQCSGLISKAGLDSLGVDYSRAVLWSIRGARIFSPSMEEMRIGDGGVRAQVVDRGRLDSLLAESAEREGVELEKGKRVVRADLNGRFVVGADGVGSCVARWSGFPEISEFVIGMQADYEEARIEEPDYLKAYFSNARFPGFFGWAIPLGRDSVRVGMGVYWRKGEARPPVDARFQEFLRSKRVAEILDGARKRSQLAGCIPVRARERSAEGRTLLVGDAAGQVKATTGGGVVFGTVAARIAAEAIAGGGDAAAGSAADAVARGGDVAANYERSWRGKLGKDLELHWRIRGALNRMPDWQMSGIFSAAKMMGLEGFLNSHGDMDRPERMLGAMGGRFAPLRALAASLIGNSNIMAASSKSK